MREPDLRGSASQDSHSPLSVTAEAEELETRTADV